MKECAYPDCKMDDSEIREMMRRRKDPNYQEPELFEHRHYRTKEEAQKAIYTFLVNFATKNGYMPNYSQIANGIGLRMQNSIPEHLKELEKQGLIIWKTGKPREYTLAGYGYMPKEN